MNQLSLLGQKLASVVDNINDRLTSYRLMLYFLLALVGWAIVGSFFDKVPYDWHQILVSTVWLVVICWGANKLISKFLDIPANKESDLITGLILALILAPPTSIRHFALLAAAAIGAMAAKYVIAVYKSHIFNPAAVGAFIAGEIFHKYASWWVGTKFMAPLIVLGSILILRKMKRFTLVGVFLAVYLLYLIYGTKTGSDLHFLWLEIIGTPVLFFAVVMLIEPLTSPSLLSKYLPYGLVVGILYSVTKLKFSPEAALLIGNIFAFLIAPNRRYEMRFLRRVKEAEGIYSYAFALPPKFKFTAGQYMEWTLAHHKTDSRGNRRYLTVSSSPTEPGVMFTIKQPPAKPSAFKQKLAELKPGETVLASDLSGSFKLPKDTSKKLAFLAGGVGITPFRSMVKYLVDSGQKRDIALLYSASTPGEFSFQNLFKTGAQAGLKAVYVTGQADSKRISTLIPDFAQRTFYVSGPYGYVRGMQADLLKLGVKATRIITDYFPGYG
ncbi:RnfABCDGE type electron transport complex subunit D [Candidatus Saccharibacteria bacterium]|nr:RnfABCDGE type electron transport complex subunit D [Candidatus Saccharibacteria bacterium]